MINIKTAGKKLIQIICIILTLCIFNGIYWLVSDRQELCLKKINNGNPISLYEKISILNLHAGICTIGCFYCSDAAYANFQMLITNKNVIYLHSNKWLTPKIRARFKNKQFGRMAWNGDIDYALNSKEKDGAVLLNWCMLSEEHINGKQCYVAKCCYTWKVPSNTQFKITNFLTIRIHEELFYELEKLGILHPYKLICYYEK